MDSHICCFPFLMSARSLATPLSRHQLRVEVPTTWIGDLVLKSCQSPWWWSTPTHQSLHIKNLSFAMKKEREIRNSRSIVYSQSSCGSVGHWLGWLAEESFKEVDTASKTSSGRFGKWCYCRLGPVEKALTQSYQAWFGPSFLPCQICQCFVCVYSIGKENKVLKKAWNTSTPDCNRHGEGGRGRFLWPFEVVAFALCSSEKFKKP